jgi:anti-sigma factor RsiW
MKKLSDEILNKYIDGELDYASAIRVNEILSTSIEDKKSYQSLLTIHNELKKIKEEFVEDNFTHRVMNRLLSRKKAYKEQRNFVLAVSSVFVFFILVIIGIVIYSAASAPISSQSSQSYSQIIVSTSQSIVSGIAQIFTPRGISIFGSILSIGILISGYFFFESIKSTRFKNNEIN